MFFKIFFNVLYTLMRKYYLQTFVLVKKKKMIKILHLSSFENNQHKFSNYKNQITKHIIKNTKHIN